MASCEDCTTNVIPDTEGLVHKCSKCGTTWVSKSVCLTLKRILGVDFYWERV